MPTSSAATSAELELDPSLWPTLAPNLKAFHVLGSVGIYFGDSGTSGDDAIKEALSKPMTNMLLFGSASTCSHLGFAS